MKKGEGISGKESGICKGREERKNLLVVGKHKEFGNIRPKVGRCGMYG